jgi:hypothetical protein
MAQGWVLARAPEWVLARGWAKVQDWGSGRELAQAMVKA